jgi:hypothetical protein
VALDIYSSILIPFLFAARQIQVQEEVQRISFNSLPVPHPSVRIASQTPSGSIVKRYVGWMIDIDKWALAGADP